MRIEIEPYITLPPSVEAKVCVEVTHRTATWPYTRDIQETHKFIDDLTIEDLEAILNDPANEWWDGLLIKKESHYIDAEPPSTDKLYLQSYNVEYRS